MEDLKSKGFGPNLIAKEMALDISEFCYRPDVMKHVPGIANKAADALSRLLQPGSKAIIPEVFKNVERVKLVNRGSQTFRTLAKKPTHHIHM